MPRIILAAMIGLGLAISPTISEPSRAADPETVNKIVTGALGLAVLGAVIKSRRDDKSHIAAPPPPPSHDKARSPRPHRDSHRLPHAHGKGAHRPNVHSQRQRPQILPAQCLRQVETHRGPRQAYGARCLHRNTRGAHRLPQHCQRDVYINGNPRVAYGARCLYRDGWRQSATVYPAHR